MVVRRKPGPYRRSIGLNKGLSTKVTVDLREFLHQSDRDSSTKVTVDKFLSRKGFGRTASTKVTVFFGEKKRCLSRLISSGATIAG